MESNKIWAALLQCWCDQHNAIIEMEGTKDETEDKNISD